LRGEGVLRYLKADDTQRERVRTLKRLVEGFAYWLSGAFWAECSFHVLRVVVIPRFDCI